MTLFKPLAALVEMIAEVAVNDHLRHIEFRESVLRHAWANAHRKDEEEI